MTLEEILQLESPQEQIKELKKKPFTPPRWEDLEKEYNPKEHAVKKKDNYPDIIGEDGKLQRVSRVSFDLERLAVKRMAEITFASPPVRDYQYDKENGNQARVAEIIESVFKKTRINATNFNRAMLLYASCEMATLWYEVPKPEVYAGEKMGYKLRTRVFSPMKGDGLYPLFDDYGDMVAFSIDTKVDKRRYFDTYTENRHIQFLIEDGKTTVEIDEEIEDLKIPIIYMLRELPAWEDNSDKREEMEWMVSRNGNYIRDNSKPMLAVFADGEIETIDDEDRAEAGDPNRGKGIHQFPVGSDVKFVTWDQSVENIRQQLSTLKEAFFTSLQIPDISYSEMKTAPMSGEARKQLFIDVILKSIRESGAWVEALDREVNIVKAFLKRRLPQELAKEVDNVYVETSLRPFVLDDEQKRINLIISAHGAKILSQREAVKRLGWADDIDGELEAINESRDVFPTYE